jgi:hypothetical protein
MLRLILVCLLLSSCTAANYFIPSLKYCDELTYVRKGDVADIEAHNCKVRP